jgi:hypothetical protein
VAQLQAAVANGRRLEEAKLGILASNHRDVAADVVAFR